MRKSKTQHPFTRDADAIIEGPAGPTAIDTALDDHFALAYDLRNLGRLIAPSLRKALEAKPDVEAKQRLEKLLEQAAKTTPPEVLRVGRALEALDLMGGSDAVQSLEAVRKDARTAWLRQAAEESLRRQGGADR